MLMLLLMLVLGVLWMSSAEEPCLEECLLSGVDSGGGRRLWLQLRVVRFHHHLRGRVRNDITWKAERRKSWRCQCHCHFSTIRTRFIFPKWATDDLSTRSAAPATRAIRRRR